MGGAGSSFCGKEMLRRAKGRASVKKRCGEELGAAFCAGRGCRRAEGRAGFYEESVFMGVGKGPGRRKLLGTLQQKGRKSNDNVHLFQDFISFEHFLWADKWVVFLP